MAEVAIKISELPVPTLAAFMEAVAAHPDGDMESLAEFAGFSWSTARKALPTPESLNVLQSNGGGQYTVAIPEIRRGMADSEAETVLRKALLGYRPFELICEGLALGERSQDVLRKTALLVGASETEAERLPILLRWGLDLGVLTYEGDEVTLAAQYQPGEVEELSVCNAADVESEARARLFNARRLGRAAHNYLDEIDRQLLADALLSYSAKPRDSVDSSGQALEDFLREISTAKGLAAEAKKASGAGQLANLLQTRGVIHSHHQKLVDAASTIRNATAHRKDRKTLAPWHITPEGAFTTHALTLTAIRSIYHFITNGRQTL